MKTRRVVTMLKAMIIGTTVYLLAFVLLVEWAPIINQSLVRIGYSLTLPKQTSGLGLLLMKATLLSVVALLTGDWAVSSLRRHCVRH